jgi:glutathione S-transferase
MVDLVLIGSGTSPFVRKCRVAAHLLGLDLTFQLEQQWSANSNVPDFNPLAKVPVLITPDLGSLFDSRVIVAELERRAGRRLRSTTGKEAILDMRLEALGDGIGEATALSVQETWRPAGTRSAIWSERQFAKVRRGIAALATDPIVMNSDIQKLSIGTIAAICALEFVNFWLPHEDWSASHTELAAKLNQLTATEAFQTTKPIRAAGFMPPKL